MADHSRKDDTLAKPGHYEQPVPILGIDNTEPFSVKLRRWLSDLLKPANLLTFSIAVATCFQSCVTRWQLNEMHNGGRDSLDAANRVIGNMNWLARTMDGSLKESQLSRQLGERPWLTISSFEMEEEPKANVGIRIQMGVENSGRTPALHVIVRSKAFSYPFVPPVPTFQETAPIPSVAIISPRSSSTTFDVIPLTMNGYELSRYESKAMRLYVRGVISYTDTNERSAETTFCIFHTYGQLLKQYSFCSVGNEAK
jgi:hypothetical protein